MVRKAVQEWHKQPWEMKTNKWAITYWLTDGRTIDTLNALTQVMPSNWALEGQIEQGHCKDDKLHAQLFLKTEQTRGTKVQKYFPDCHISEAENPFALKRYVHKEDTRVAEFKTVENRSPQWHVVCDKFFDYLLLHKPHTQHTRDEEEKWRIWDEWICDCIREGMRIELVGINPQYRGCINKYWSGFWDAAWNRANVQIPETIVDRQTDKTEVVAPPPSLGRCRSALISQNILPA